LTAEFNDIIVLHGIRDREPYILFCVPFNVIAGF